MDEISGKVNEWLLKEGYPLEFRAASIMRRCGFAVRQGHFVRSGVNEAPREIDIVAQTDDHCEDYLFRVCQVVECKYSKSKPWVIFSSPSGRMSTSACASQSIASEYGSAIMWSIAGHDTISEMKLFSSPQTPGFNGREAFSTGHDRFYGAVTQLIENSISLSKYYNSNLLIKGKIPKSCVVVFPILLLDGMMFEAFCDEEKSETVVQEIEHARLHWKGAPSRNLHSTFDIVKLDYFEKFCNTRMEESVKLLSEFRKQHRKV